MGDMFLLVMFRICNSFQNFIDFVSDIVFDSFFFGVFSSDIRIVGQLEGSFGVDFGQFCFFVEVGRDILLRIVGVQFCVGIDIIENFGVVNG